MSSRQKHPSTATGGGDGHPPPSRTPWSHPIAVSEVPDTGSHVEFSADEATRQAVAKVAGLVALPRLEASFDLSRQGSEGLRAVGRVTATVVQNCVVTLEPIENEVDEAIDLAFTPQADAGSAKSGAAYQAIDAEDPPEPLQNGAVDLGAAAIEFLLLGIDPYPRKDGVTFDVPPAKDPGAHPFAALAALKPPKDREDG